MATLNGTYSSAPDTPSPVYPDRLIRPLPKRSLRGRLSTDAADSILYPAAPSATQLFYGYADNEAVNESKYVRNVDTPERSSERKAHVFGGGVEYESDENGPVVVRRSAGFRGASVPSASSTQPGHDNEEGTPVKSAGPDGYDAFENTNNKKKRKIPTPGSLSHPSTLSPEFSNMGLSSSTPTPVNDGSGTYYGTGDPASPVGSVSGPGRGRLGRVARGGSGRIPLAVQTQSAWANARMESRRDGLSESTGDSKLDQGIISAAIANAATFSPQGSSVGLLEHQQITPNKPQFTFTCESNSAKDMAKQTSFPINRSPTSPSKQQRGVSTQGTQTSPSVAAQHQGTSQAPVDQTAGKKKKRSPASLYSLAARQRKIQQQAANLHHPPSMEDLWICEFCEYESIFGRPPEALIRQYEIKDRQERKRLAEKKRLLEKAKMKGRKGKKATKNAKNNAAPSGHHHDRASVDHSSGGSGEHDDDYGPEDEEPAAPPPTHPPSLKPPAKHPKMAANTFGSKDTIDGGINRPP